MLGNLQIYVQRITYYYCWGLASEAGFQEADQEHWNNTTEKDSRDTIIDIVVSAVEVVSWSCSEKCSSETRKRGFGVFSALVFWWLWTEWFIATCLRCALRCLQRIRVAGRSHQVIIIISLRHPQDKSRKNRNWYLWADNWFMRGFNSLRCVDVRQRFFGHWG